MDLLILIVAVGLIFRRVKGSSTPRKRKAREERPCRRNESLFTRCRKRKESLLREGNREKYPQQEGFHTRGEDSVESRVKPSMEQARKAKSSRPYRAATDGYMTIPADYQVPYMTIPEDYKVGYMTMTEDYRIGYMTMPDPEERGIGQG